MTLFRFAHLSALAFATALAATTAHATTVKTGKPAASAPAARVYATREQLRSCMELEDGLKARRTALETTQAAHDRSVDALEAENAKIVEVQGNLDHDSDTAVQAFNLLVADHNVHVKQINEDAAKSREAAAAYNVDTLALNRQCASLVYRVDDMDAVMKERRAAGK